MAGVAYDVSHPLFEKREDILKIGYIVVTSDRGLRGAYNTNILRLVTTAIEEDGRNLESGVIAVGRKGRDFFRKRGIVDAEFISLGDKVN